MSTTIVCTAAQFNQFWTDTFTDLADNIYVDDGGPSEHEWVEGDRNPDMVWRWTGGWLGFQTAGGVSLDDLTVEQRQRVDRWCDSDLATLFDSWQRHGAASMTVTVSIPADPTVLEALDAFLADHGGSRGGN